MGTETKRKGLPSQRVLKAVVEGLEEISAYFGWQNSAMDSSGMESVEQEEAEIEQQEEDLEAEEYDDYEDDYLDREEVEVAVDAFISTLLTSEVIRKPKSGKILTFKGVFTTLFGQGEVVDLAFKFEDAIDGYMGWISPEEMQSAESLFAKICDLVNALVEKKTDEL